MWWRHAAYIKRTCSYSLSFNAQRLGPLSTCSTKRACNRHERCPEFNVRRTVLSPQPTSSGVCARSSRSGTGSDQKLSGNLVSVYVMSIRCSLSSEWLAILPVVVSLLLRVPTNLSAQVTCPPPVMLPARSRTARSRAHQPLLQVSCHS